MNQRVLGWGIQDPLVKHKCGLAFKLPCHSAVFLVHSCSGATLSLRACAFGILETCGCGKVFARFAWFGASTAVEGSFVCACVSILRPCAHGARLAPCQRLVLSFLCLWTVSVFQRLCPFRQAPRSPEMRVTLGFAFCFFCAD